jgi:hypothetical protein
LNFRSIKKGFAVDDWVPFKEGEYLAEQAFLMGQDGSAVPVARVIVRVFSGKTGGRRMDGQGRIHNVLLIQLLEDNDEMDLLLDMGGDFKYILRDPVVKAGKVFSPEVRSVLHFTPREPLEKVGKDEFEQLLSTLKIVSASES